MSEKSKLGANRAPESTHIHPTAELADDLVMGPGCRIWNQAQIREHVMLGSRVVISKNVYVDHGVRIGNDSKIQNNVSIFAGVTIEDGVFVGPHVCFTNDRVPRALNPDGSQKNADDWNMRQTLIQRGASIGAHSVILPGLSIGTFAMIGAGSVVTRSVPDHALVAGNPARQMGWVCECGNRLLPEGLFLCCPSCGNRFTIFEANLKPVHENAAVN